MSIGKTYHVGINVNIMRVKCFITDSQGYMLGWADHIYPYQCDNYLSIKERKVSFTADTRNPESCLTEVDNKQLDMWNQRLGHLSAAGTEKMQTGNMVTRMSLPHVNLSKHVCCSTGKC